MITALPASITPRLPTDVEREFNSLRVDPGHNEGMPQEQPFDLDEDELKVLKQFLAQALASQRAAIAAEVLKILDEAELKSWFDQPNTIENWKTWKRIRNTISDNLTIIKARGE